MTPVSPSFSRFVRGRSRRCGRTVQPVSRVERAPPSGLGAWLRARYRIRIASRAFARDGFLAGTDAERALELASAMRDPEVKAIVAARGGYGAMRIVDELFRVQELRPERPKWIVGFSDITALHASAWREGVASAARKTCPNVTGARAERRPSRRAGRAAWLGALERPSVRLGRWEGLRSRAIRRASGGSGRRREPRHRARDGRGRAAGDLPDGAIVALEDVTEAPYRVDRMIGSRSCSEATSARVSAVVFGGFDRLPSSGVQTGAVRSRRCLAERTSRPRHTRAGGRSFGTRRRAATKPSARRAERACRRRNAPPLSRLEQPSIALEQDEGAQLL